MSLFSLVINAETPIALRLTLAGLCLVQCLLLWSAFVWLVQQGLSGERMQALLPKISRAFALLLLGAGLFLIGEAALGFWRG